MDDPPLVRMRKPFEDLCGRLDRLGIAQLARPHRVAQGLAADVLVGDVDMPRVGAETVGAQAALVPQAGRRLGLALRAMGRLALAGDDLERDVEPVVLVAREPHGARAAAAQRAQRPVAVEDQFLARERLWSDRHDLWWVGRGG